MRLRSERGFVGVLTIVILVLAVIGLMALCSGPAEAQASRVTICHATGSTTNPYVVITPSAAGVYNGHLGGDHQNGEDIIPPFEWQGQTYSQNWDAAGQAIFNNGCQVPEEPSPTPTPTPSPDPSPSPDPDDPDRPDRPDRPERPDKSDPPVKRVPKGLAFTGTEEIALGGLALLLLIGGAWVWHKGNSNRRFGY